MKPSDGRICGQGFGWRRDVRRQRLGAGAEFLAVYDRRRFCNSGGATNTGGLARMEDAALTGKERVPGKPYIRKARRLEQLLNALAVGTPPVCRVPDELSSRVIPHRRIRNIREVQVGL